jgi:hypothetical protein
VITASLKKTLIVSLVLLFAVLLLVLVSDRENQDATAVLKTIPQSFLATTRHEGLQVHHIDTGNTLLGPREGVAHIQITAHSGVNLAEINAKDVVREGNRMTVRLPEPRVLAIEPDLGSYRTIARQSVLQHLKDSAGGKTMEDELFERTQEAIANYRNSDPSPARTEIVDRLNRESQRFFGPDSGVKFE